MAAMTYDAELIIPARKDFRVKEALQVGRTSWSEEHTAWWSSSGDG